MITIEETRDIATCRALRALHGSEVAAETVGIST